MEQPGVRRARRDLAHLASCGARQRQGRRRANEGEAEVGDAAVAVVEGERGPDAAVAIGRRLLIDVVLSVVIVLELRRLVIVVVRVRMAVRLGGSVVVEVDWQGERGAVGSVGVVQAMTRNVAHRSQDPADHERGELNDRGLGP
jgi:hypothetical protein